MPRRAPGRPLDRSPAPNYAHDARYMVLPPGIRLPRVDDCADGVAYTAGWWGISLYSSAYSHKASRLVLSCEHVGVCCRPTFVPEGAFTNPSTGGSGGRSAG
ncbi:MAG: hypothetical protein SGPRY_006388 [Prymnesium sp.]